MIFGGSGSTLLNGANSWVLAPSGISTPSMGAVGPVDGFIPNEPLVARDLFVRIGAIPGAGKHWTFSIRSGANALDLACTISDGSTVCDSGSRSIPIPATGQIYFHAVQSNTPADTLVDFSYRLTTP